MADLTSAAKAVRSEVWHQHGTHRLERSRVDWPELHRLIDEMIEVLNIDDPPRELPPLEEPTSRIAKDRLVSDDGSR